MKNRPNSSKSCQKPLRPGAAARELRRLAQTALADAKKISQQGRLVSQRDRTGALGEARKALEACVALDEAELPAAVEQPPFVIKIELRTPETAQEIETYARAVASGGHADFGDPELLRQAYERGHRARSSNVALPSHQYDPDAARRLEQPDEEIVDAIVAIDRNSTN